MSNTFFDDESSSHRIDYYSLDDTWNRFQSSFIPDIFTYYSIVPTPFFPISHLLCTLIQINSILAQSAFYLSHIIRQRHQHTLSLWYWCVCVVNGEMWKSTLSQINLTKTQSFSLDIYNIKRSRLAESYHGLHSAHWKLLTIFEIDKTSFFFYQKHNINCLLNMAVMSSIIFSTFPSHFSVSRRKNQKIQLNFPNS